jgi:hypothetical protein
LFAEVEQSRESERRSKRLANTEEARSEALENVFQNQASMTDTSFQMVGGDVAARLARGGGSMLDARGQGAFGFSPSIAAPRAPMALEDKDPKSDQKKSRVIEVDSFATKALTWIDKELLVTREKCIHTLKESSIMLIKAAGASDESEALPRFVNILKQRRDLLEKLVGSDFVPRKIETLEEVPTDKGAAPSFGLQTVVVANQHVDPLCQSIRLALEVSQADGGLALQSESIRAALMLNFGVDAVSESISKVLVKHGITAISVGRFEVSDMMNCCETWPLSSLRRQTSPKMKASLEYIPS